MPNAASARQDQNANLQPDPLSSNLNNSTKQQRLQAAYDASGAQKISWQGGYINGRYQIEGYLATSELMAGERACDRCKRIKKPCKVIIADNWPLGVFKRLPRKCGSCHGKGGPNSDCSFLN
jgi:hypothetical protein